MNVLIAGASRGLGLALTRAAVERGDQVVAVARDLGNAQGLEALAKTAGGQLQLVEQDLAEPAAGVAIRQLLGAAPLDLAIFNAGVKIPIHQEVTAVTADETATLFTTNAIAPVRVAQQLADCVVDGGVMAFLSSQMGSLQLNLAAAMPLYGASKAALNSLLRSWVQQMGSLRFSVLALHPGWVRTDMGGEDAAVSPEASAAGLLRVTDDFRGRNQESFMDYLGRPMPW